MGWLTDYNAATVAAAVKRAAAAAAAVDAAAVTAELRDLAAWLKERHEECTLPDTKFHFFAADLAAPKRDMAAVPKEPKVPKDFPRVLQVTKAFPTETKVTKDFHKKPQVIKAFPTEHRVLKDFHKEPPVPTAFPKEPKAPKAFLKEPPVLEDVHKKVDSDMSFVVTTEDKKPLVRTAEDTALPVSMDEIKVTHAPFQERALLLQDQAKITTPSFFMDAERDFLDFRACASAAVRLRTICAG